MENDILYQAGVDLQTKALEHCSRFHRKVLVVLTYSIVQSPYLNRCNPHIAEGVSSQQNCHFQNPK